MKWPALAMLGTLAALAFLSAARAETVVVLNSEEGSYSLLSRTDRSEIARLPIGREPHHLVLSPDGKEVLVSSTAVNEIVMLDPYTGERRRVVRDIVDPYHLGYSPDGKWFVTAANRLDHIDIYSADGFKLAGRTFVDALPSHLAFDSDSRTVFVTLQASGLLAAVDLATQAIKWSVPVGKAPAGIVMLPASNRLMVALTGEDGFVIVDPTKGNIIGRVRTGNGAHNFWPKGDGRHYFLSNRIASTISLVDTQEMKVVGEIRVPGGPDDMDITADGKELWVTQRFSRRVAIVDLEQMKVVATINVGKSPHGLMILKSPPEPGKVVQR